MACRVEAPSPLPAAASHLHGPEAEVHRLVCWPLSRAGGQRRQGRALGSARRPWNSACPHRLTSHSQPEELSSQLQAVCVCGGLCGIDARV